MGCGLLVRSAWARSVLAETSAVSRRVDAMRTSVRMEKAIGRKAGREEREVRACA